VNGLRGAAGIAIVNVELFTDHSQRHFNNLDQVNIKKFST